MPGTTRAGGYRTLLTRPAVARVVVLAGLGRLGYAMLPLLLLFTIRNAAGSFAVATAATSAYGLAALAMPVKARLVDRHGQRAVLPGLGAAACTATLATWALTAAGGHPPAAFWVAAGSALGVAAPPLGPTMRAQWRVIAPDETDTAYALDGTIEEVLWLAGPALAGLLLAHPAAGVGAIGPLLLVGSLGLAGSPWAPPPAPRQARGGEPCGPLRPLAPVLLTMTLVGVSGGLTTTGIAAVADAAGVRGIAAAGEVALGVGAVAGGLAWGRWRPAWPTGTSVAVLLGVLAAAVGTLAWFGPAGIVSAAAAGAATAPVWVLAYGAADRAVPEHARTEASTWVTTVTNLGSAGGTVAAGVLVAVGVRMPLTAASAVALTAAACAVGLGTDRGDA